MAKSNPFEKTLFEIEQVRNALRRNVPIDTGRKDDEGEKILESRVDYPVYAIVHKVDAPMLDLESIVKDIKFQGTEDEIDVKRKAQVIEWVETFDLLGTQNKLDSGTAIAQSTGFYIVPLYAGISEIRPLHLRSTKVEGEAKKELYFGDTLFTIDPDTFEQRTFKLWSEYPHDLFREAAMVSDTNYTVESIVKFRRMDRNTAALEIAVNNLENIRHLRVSTGNTTTNMAYHMLGAEKYNALKAELGETSYITACYAEFKNMLHARPMSKTTGRPIEINKANFKPGKYIQDYEFFNNMKAYHKLVEAEEDIEKSLTRMVESSPVWEYYLKGIKGCGTKHAAYLLAKLDPTVCRHPSGFLRYLGLDVVYDSKWNRMAGRSKKNKRRMTYINKDGNVAVNDTLGYDTKMKARIWLIAQSMMRAMDPHYYALYNNAKAYYENRPDLKERWEKKKNGDDSVKGDASSPHRMALRKMMASFVVDLWLAERKILGLPLNGGTYGEEKLGIRHHGYESIPVGVGAVANA